ncbi:hypothetical protein [Streptomyces luteogriseus]
MDADVVESVQVRSLFFRPQRGVGVESVEGGEQPLGAMWIPWGLRDA